MTDVECPMEFPYRPRRSPCCCVPLARSGRLPSGHQIDLSCSPERRADGRVVGPAGPARDLYWGVGGKRLAPDGRRELHRHRDQALGLQPGLHRVRQRRRPLERKFPPEASTEVVASRIHWGIGYHQPPIYYVAEWAAEKAMTPNPQLPARFREAKPDLHGLDANGDVVLLPQSVRRHAAARRAAGPPGHARQLRSEGRQQRDLRPGRAVRRREAAGTSRAIWATPSAEPA